MGLLSSAERVAEENEEQNLENSNPSRIVCSVNERQRVSILGIILAHLSSSWTREPLIIAAFSQAH